MHQPSCCYSPCIRAALSIASPCPARVRLWRAAPLPSSEQRLSHSAATGPCKMGSTVLSSPGPQPTTRRSTAGACAFPASSTARTAIQPTTHNIQHARLASAPSSRLRAPRADNLRPTGRRYAARAFAHHTTRLLPHILLCVQADNPRRVRRHRRFSRARPAVVPPRHQAGYGGRPLARRGRAGGCGAEHEPQ